MPYFAGVVEPLGKYNVYRYIGCIIDQSNWSFSLVVMTSDQESRGHGFKSWSGHSTGSFYLQVYFSSYYIQCRDQDDYCPSPRAKLCPQSQKEPGINEIIPKHLIQMFHCSMKECGGAASEVQCV